MAQARNPKAKRKSIRQVVPAGGIYVIQPGRLRQFAQVFERDAGGRLVYQHGGASADVEVVVKPTTARGQRTIAKALKEDLVKAADVLIECRAVRADTDRPRAARRIEAEAFEPGPKARALLRGVEIARQDLSAAGGTYDLAQVEQLLNISRQAIDKRVKEGALLAVPGPGNRRRYPTAQFTRGGTLPGLRDALAALKSGNPWYQLNWLVNSDPRLGGCSPAQLLEAGEVERVVVAARAQGEQGG
jgi:hypothetical protein